MQQEGRWLLTFHKIKDWLVNHIYTTLYGILMIFLSVYIIKNWSICISMQFFSHFDGNNILFLIWIALIFLFFYDVEAKGFKFQRRRGLEREFQELGRIYVQRMIDSRRDNPLDSRNNEGESDGDDEL